MRNVFLFFFIALNFIFCKIAKSEDYKRQDLKKKYSEIVELWKSGQRDTACVRMNRLKLKSIFQQDSVLVYATCCTSGVFNFKLYNFDAAIFNYKKAVTVCDNNLFYRYKVYLRLA